MKHPYLITVFFMLLPALTQASDTRPVELPDGESMDFRVVAATSPEEGMLIGFPCDEGMREVELGMSEAISEKGVEVWMADLLGTRFLSAQASSMRRLKGDDIVAMIQDAHDATGKKVYLITAGFGAIPVLRGARDWKKLHKGTVKEQWLGGAILLYPELNAKEPEPGMDMEYLPVTSQTSIPVYILQPELTPARFWLDQLKAELEKGGATVTIDILPRVRGYFFMRPNATDHEKSMSQVLPNIVVNALHQMQAAEEQ